MAVGSLYLPVTCTSDALFIKMASSLWRIACEAMLSEQVECNTCSFSTSPSEAIWPNLYSLHICVCRGCACTHRCIPPYVRYADEAVLYLETQICFPVCRVQDNTQLRNRKFCPCCNKARLTNWSFTILNTWVLSGGPLESRYTFGHSASMCSYISRPGPWLQKLLEKVLQELPPSYTVAE